MDKVAISTARCTVRLGSRASSASGAAPSKPPKARMVNTDPANTPVRPWYLDGVCEVPNTDQVLCEPACTIRNTASTTNTAISNAPSIVPSRAEVCTPYQPAASTISAPSSAHGHHRLAREDHHSEFI